MKRIILFSKPTEKLISDIGEKMFPKELANKTAVYMAADNSNKEKFEKYFKEWKKLASQYSYNLIAVDNSVDSPAEHKKILDSSVLLISGGPTFILLSRLRQNHFDNTILEFIKKSSFVLSGFSAGAIVLTPSVRIADSDFFQENTINYPTYDGLRIVDFEVLPHFKSPDWDIGINKYRENSSNEVKTITDDEYILIDK